MISQRILEQLGVIIINTKRKILFISFLLFLFASIFLNAKLHYKQDVTVPTKETVEEDIEYATNEADDDESFIDVLSKDDPVRTFLSEKLQAAIDLLFHQDVNIVAIGDSLTQGVGDETGNGGYVGILQERLNNAENPTVQITNLGKRGNRTDQLIKRLEEEEEVILAMEDADVILITIGANDIMQIFQQNITKLSLEAFEDGRQTYHLRLQMIYDKLTELNEDANIYFIGFYNPYFQYFPDVEELNTIMEMWNNEIRLFTETTDRATFIPVKEMFDNATFHFLADDNFHPNYDGYEMFANQIIDYLIAGEGELHEEQEKSAD